MTAVAHSAYPARRPVSAPLRAVGSAARSNSAVNLRKVSIVIVAGIAIFIARLFISVAIDAGAYQIDSLNRQSVNLTRDANYLDEQLDVLNSPQNLSTVARKLGMINNNRPAYLRLSDGHVWGDPHTVAGTVAETTGVANELLGKIGTVPTIKGVATTRAMVVGTESKPAGTTTNTSSGIPAPTTH